MTIGFIISAGKQTRFNDSTPKALAIYDGETVLQHNINIMKDFCDDIYVVCSEDNKNWFKNYNCIIIKENLGCGDTVAKALSKYINKKQPILGTKCIIQWGDSIQTRDVYNSLSFDKEKSPCIQVPCYLEYKPYVDLELYSNYKIKKVLFSKFNESTSSSGNHDCSLFYGSIYYIYQMCLDYMTLFRKKDGYEDFGHGKEFNFLDIFNKVNAHGVGIFFKGEVPDSYNTKEELYDIGGYI